MGELIGYARVSSRSQSLDIQIDALTNAGVKNEHMYLETVAGRQREGRVALEDLLRRGICNGDTVVCTKLDRLARSTRDLLQISETRDAKGVNLKVLGRPIDTTTTAGRLFFTI